MKRNQKSSDALTTALGGVEMPVVHHDGKHETVKVRQLPVEFYPKFQQALVTNNELMLTVLYCDRSVEWVRSLTSQSYSQVADKGEELNLPFFGAWVRRGRARNEATNPGFTAKAEKMMEETLRDRLSSLATGSSTSAP